MEVWRSSPLWGGGPADFAEVEVRSAEMCQKAEVAPHTPALGDYKLVFFRRRRQRTTQRHVGGRPTGKLAVSEA